MFTCARPLPCASKLWQRVGNISCGVWIYSQRAADWRNWYCTEYKFYNALNFDNANISCGEYIHNAHRIYWRGVTVPHHFIRHLNITFTTLQQYTCAVPISPTFMRCTNINLATRCEYFRNAQRIYWLRVTFNFTTLCLNLYWCAGAWMLLCIVLDGDTYGFSHNAIDPHPII